MKSILFSLLLAVSLCASTSAQTTGPAAPKDSIGRTVSPTETKARLASPSSYFTLGASLGTPAGLNLMVGYTFDRIFTRLSGMDYGDGLHGVQVEGGIILKRTERTALGIGLMAGSSRIVISSASDY